MIGQNKLTSNSKCLAGTIDVKSVIRYTKKEKIPMYRLLSDTLYEKFEDIYPEYSDNKKSRKNQFIFKCFVKECINGNVDKIDREYLMSNYKKYNSVHLDYYIERYGDVEGVDKYKERQSTTSKSKFIKKYGTVDGVNRYKEHFDNIHKKIRGENHWLKRDGVISYKDYWMKKSGMSNDDIVEILTHSTKWKVDGLSESNINEKRSEHGKYARSCVEKTNTLGISKTISKMKSDCTFYTKFGCWKLCYDYSIKNDMEYTDENRVKIWNILFNTTRIEYWLNKGHSTESAEVERVKYIPKSKVSISVIKEIEKKLDITIEQEKWIGRYIADGKYENYIIEFFGDYWHMNPYLYEEVDCIRGGKTAKEIWKYDDEKLNFYIDSGYIPIVIWENDWNTSKGTVLENLRKIIE